MEYNEKIINHEKSMSNKIARSRKNVLKDKCIKYDESIFYILIH